jgi:5'-AMP-activated protein kinase catalytic alpha subunit
LIDFGLGNLYRDSEQLKTACGSPCYAAPEIISGDLYDPIPVDIWSSGISLYAMLCGYLPFDEESKSVLYKKILACDYMIPSHVSSDATDLIKKMLVVDPKKRLDIKGIINHRFFKLYQPN